MSHSLCVMGMYDEVKVTVPMIVHYVHNDKKNVTLPASQTCVCLEELNYDPPPKMVLGSGRSQTCQAYDAL
jgi:hypothetical protein